MSNILASILRGVGQVMLQENSYSGLIMLVAIAFNSPYLAVLALGATIVATLFAWLMKYSPADIERGLYGYNATLVGIACGVFLQPSLWALILCLLLVILSTYVTHISMRQSYLPTLTAPFVLITWALLFFVKHFEPSLLLPAVDHPHELDSGIISTLGIGMGQIMFQENAITGYLFLLALLVHSRRAFVYALLASLFTLLLMLGNMFDPMSLKLGLYEYNAVLVAIALSSGRGFQILPLLAGLLLATIFQYLGMKWGISTLTGLFVLAVWGVLLFQKGIRHFQQRAEKPL